MKWLSCCFLILAPAAVLWAASPDEIAALVSAGHWQQAREEIRAELQQTNVDFETRQALLFQRDRMARMLLDFNQSRDQVLRQARAVIPGVTDEQFAAWEKSGAVEFIDIDGQRHYFHSAAANLFRINPEARALKAKSQPNTADSLPYRLVDLENVVSNYDRTGEAFNSPRRRKITYRVSVDADAVPAGEVIRAWLPFPHAGNRQKAIRLISSEPARHILADTNDGLSSIYLEKQAVAGQPTQFKVVFEYTSDAFYHPIDPAKVTAVDASDPALKPFMGEEPPQIVFSDTIKKLSHEIVGDETNPGLIAQRLFAWSATHIPWAPAREYSTITCLPHYALTSGHGDCGIKTMTFMTLCRYSGIPARWESGWITGVEKDMHDWCEIYLAPYGWVPMDVTYGFTDSPDERLKWFYFGDIDADRLVLNTDFEQPLYPAKTHFRSEIVDFQRGEVEWRGGNLYFNQWNWDFQVEDLPTAGKSAAAN